MDDQFLDKQSRLFLLVESLLMQKYRQRYNMERKRTKINGEEESPIKLPVMVLSSMSYLLIIIHLRKITKVEFKLERSKTYEN